jgi:hypothetical protein
MFFMCLATKGLFAIGETLGACILTRQRMPGLSRKQSGEAMSRIIERLRGHGVLGGERLEAEVSYALEVRQDMIGVGHIGDPSAAFPGEVMEFLYQAL